MKEKHQETIPVPRPAGQPDGRSFDSEGGPPLAPARSNLRGRSKRKLAGLSILLIVLAAGVYLGYQYWWDQGMYVSTDNAQVAGNLVSIGALNAGRVESVRVNVGDSIQEGQVVGTILLPSITSVSQSGAPVLGFVGAENQRTEIKSPMTGVVVARSANPGATIAAGQPLITLIDPTQVWVSANIDEAKSQRVRVGQQVEVHLDALDATVPGRVEAVTPATASTFSLVPQSNTTGNFTKVTQVVTVRVAVDLGGRTAPLGSSVSVKIRVD